MQRKILFLRKFRTAGKLLIGNFLSIFKIFRSVVNGFERFDSSKDALVISLTSYNRRFSVVWLTLLSLIYQRGCNFRVDLWLSYEDYLRRGLKLKAIEYLYQGKVKIHKCEDDKSLKKINSFAFGSEGVIAYITADDDVYYEKDWLRNLLEKNKQYPESIIFNRGWEVGISNGRLNEYNSWTEIDSSSEILFFTGVGGVLYPSLIAREFYDDAKKIKELYVNADDVLLNYLAVKKGVSLVYCENSYIFEDWIFARFSALGNVNVIENRNDSILSIHYEREILKNVE